MKDRLGHEGQSQESVGLAFLLLSGSLPGLHGCVFLGHVENVDMLPVANGPQQAEESKSPIPSKERLKAVKHHSLAAVTQLKPERGRQLRWPQGHLFSLQQLVLVLVLLPGPQLVLQTY